MSENEIDNPPAFPERHMGFFGDTEQEYTQSGMTLRDYFAAKAMQAILNKEGVYDNGGPGANPCGIVTTEAAKHAYQFADAMLKERSKSV